MPGMDGIEATQLITAGDARSRVLVLTTFDHVARLLTKLGARDRVQLVITAYQTGLVQAPH